MAEMLRLLALCSLASCLFAADTMPPEAERRLAREIYKEMIESKSGFTTGATTPIAESVAARLKAAGFADFRYLRGRRDSAKGECRGPVSRHGRA